MMKSILPWSSKKENTLATTKPSTELASQTNNSIEVHHELPLARPSGGTMVQVRSKQVMIAGKSVEVDPYQLIRLIKRVTQNIGEYKDLDDIYSAIVCGSLRKARGDLVSILETQFHIHWQVENGKSVFFM